MVGHNSGFYHDPPLWVSSSAINANSPGVRIDFDAFHHEVFSTTLSCGVKVQIAREGLFAFNYEGWQPGHYPDETGGLIAPFQQKADAVFNRTVVMNAFLAFLYTSMLRVGSSMLKRFVVTPELVISLEDMTANSGMGFGNANVAHLALSGYVSTYRSDVPIDGLPTEPTARRYRSDDPRRRHIQDVFIC